MPGGKVVMAVSAGTVPLRPKGRKGWCKRAVEKEKVSILYLFFVFPWQMRDRRSCTKGRGAEGGGCFVLRLLGE